MPPPSFQALSFLNPDEGGWERVDDIAARIGRVRDTLVILDEHLAEALGVSVRELLAAFLAHEPVPGEFRFMVEPRRPTTKMPRPQPPAYAFTEHGALLAALFLDRPDAASLSVQVVRAFIRRRRMLAGELAN